jgi:DNA replication protein DnaC
MEDKIIPLHRSSGMTRAGDVAVSVLREKITERRKKKEAYLAACREKYGDKSQRALIVDERPIARISAPPRYQKWTCPQCKVEIDNDEKYGFLKKPDGSIIPCPLCSTKPLAAKNRRISEKLIAQLVQLGKLRSMSNLPANAARLTMANYPERGDKRAKKEVQLFIDGGTQSLFLVGPAGRGKTGLAVAAAHEMISQGKQVLFLEFERYVELIRENFDTKLTGEKNEVKRIMELVDTLIVDDFAAGSNSAFTLKEALVLVDARENAGLKTLITCNYDYPDMEKFYRSESTKFQPVERLTSRLVGQYKRAPFTGPDLRQG